MEFMLKRIPILSIKSAFYGGLSDGKAGSGKVAQLCLQKKQSFGTPQNSV